MRWTTWMLPALAAAALAAASEPAFKPADGWLPLFNGKDLSGWKAVGRYKSEWRVEDGVLVNPRESDSIYTEKSFLDFKLHLEVKLPKEGNSGIFLRGRKEVQACDSYGKKTLDDQDCGGIFGVHAPAVNACKPPGEWNTFDITIVGRKITVVLNGTTVVDGKVVNGVTGGQLDDDEDKPGPLMLQGDHSGVSYRNLWIKPLSRGE